MSRPGRTLAMALGAACIAGSWIPLSLGHLGLGTAAMLGGFALAQSPLGWRSVAAPLAATAVAPPVFWLLLLLLRGRSGLPPESLPIHCLAGIPIAFAAVAFVGLPSIALLRRWMSVGPLVLVAIGMLAGALVLASIPLLAGMPESLLASKQAALLAVGASAGAASGLAFHAVAGVQGLRGADAA